MRGSRGEEGEEWEEWEEKTVPQVRHQLPSCNDESVNESKNGALRWLTLILPPLRTFQHRGNVLNVVRVIG